MVCAWGERRAPGAHFGCSRPSDPRFPSPATVSPPFSWPWTLLRHWLRPFSWCRSQRRSKCRTRARLLHNQWGKCLIPYHHRPAFQQVCLTSRFDKDWFWAGIGWHGTGGAEPEAEQQWWAEASQGRPIRWFLPRSTSCTDRDAVIAMVWWRGFETLVWLWAGVVEGAVPLIHRKDPI